MICHSTYHYEFHHLFWLHLIPSGDVGAASDAFGASAGGRGAERGSHGCSPEGLQPPTPRRRGETTQALAHTRRASIYVPAP